MTIVKDISLLKMGATGERLINKIQDFMWDEVLFDYCALPEVYSSSRSSSTFEMSLACSYSRC